MKPRKRTFMVRMNCEYSIEIKAADEEEATDKANRIPPDDWTYAWSETEAEDTDE